MSFKSERPFTHERLLLRIIGKKRDVLRFLQDLEEFLGERLYPDPPSADTRYGGIRVYVEVPLYKERRRTK